MKIIPVVLIILLIGIYACHNSNESSSHKQSAQISVERGKYLVETVASCMHCHSQRDFTKFSGPLNEATAGMGGVSYPKFGVLYSSNITPDTTTGIGKWSDDEIARAITQGIARDGDTLFPIMPYYEYNKMCKEDVYSMVAYLRTIKPISNKIPERKLKTFASAEWKQFDYLPAGTAISPAATDTIETGRYLATIAACVTCHTPKTEEDHFVQDQYYAGGDMMGKKFGFTVNSCNITPDLSTGIGTWSKETFVNKFKSFSNPASYSSDPGKHNTIMPWIMFSNMKEKDLEAIYAYLRTIKPVSNKVTIWPEEKSPDEKMMAKGHKM